MDKIIQIPRYFGETFEPSVQLIDERFGDEKVASEAWEYIKDYSPQPGHRFILVIAMGAAEWWGNNRNGDAFPEQDLLKNYLNFETKYNAQGQINGGALVFKHHKNKLAENHPWFGTVKKAFYNTKMHRVELLLDILASKGQDLIDRINSGEDLAVSMGVRIPYDECQHPNAEVVTPQGLQPICEIKLGDQVLTHKNRFRKVTRLFKNSAPKNMVRFRATGDFHEALVTPNHPMYVLQREEIFFPSGGRRKVGFQGLTLEPKWVEAGKVGDKDYLLRVIPEAGTTTVNPKMAYLAGHYLGDGHLTFDTKGKDPTKPMQVHFTSHLDDRETIVRRLADYALDLGWDVSVRTNRTVRPDGKAVRAITTSIRNRDFAKFCNDICGTKKDKRVPEAVFSWDQESIKHFLGGYIDADGCFRKHQKESPGKGGTLTSTSVIENLSRGMQTLFHMVGMSASLREDPIGKTNNNFAASSVGYVLSIAKSHAEKLRGYSRKIQTTTEFGGQGPTNFFFRHAGVNYWAMKIREKEEVSSTFTDVYNLTVEEDESYIADGFVTHNCSICHNKAKTREQYCDHLKYELNKIYPDGRKVAAINGGYDYSVHPKPLNFFDISVVFRPADPSGWMLKKVASHFSQDDEDFVGSAELAERQNSTRDKIAYLKKLSKIDKVIKGLPVAEREEDGDVKLIRAYRPTLDKMTEGMSPLGNEMTESLAHYPMNKVLSTLSHAGIILTTPEFVDLVVYKLTGRHVPLDILYDITSRQGEIFEKLSHDVESLESYSSLPMFEDTEPDQDILEILAPIVSERDLSSGGFSKRASHTDFQRSVLDLQDAQFGGDRKGMLHPEYFTDKKTGARYATTMGSIEDARLWDRVGTVGKAALAAGGLAGLYQFLKNSKSPLTPLAGIAALLLGGKFILDAIEKTDAGVGHSDSGERLPSGVSMMQKKAGFKFRKLNPWYKRSWDQKLGDSLGRGIRRGKAAAFYLPVLGTAAMHKYYEDRLRKGKVGYYADNLDRNLETAGRWAYNHPYITGATGLFAGRLGMDAADALRKAVFRR